MGYTHKRGGDTHICGYFADTIGRPMRNGPRQAALLPEVFERGDSPWQTGPQPRVKLRTKLSSLELCAGAGGQALGLEAAGVEHEGLVELDKHACATLRLNRPKWKVIEGDLRLFKEGKSYRHVDLITGGLPCPPFSVAGKQLGERDERNLFPVMADLVDEVRPKGVMIENVRGILDPAFAGFRDDLAKKMRKLGYECGWRLMQASQFGVPQLRPRVVFIALQKEISPNFWWPEASSSKPPSVGETLRDLMSANGWEGADDWAAGAGAIAPTVVGGSHKHGGPDLGPTRARRAWAELGVDGLGIANAAPEPGFAGMPRLTVRMVARLQGFPDDWQFCGGKTHQYRQVGNAFPPPFAQAVASCLHAAIVATTKVRAAG